MAVMMMLLLLLLPGLLDACDTPPAAIVSGCPSWDVMTIDAELACDDKRMVQYRFVVRLFDVHRCVRS